MALPPRQICSAGTSEEVAAFIALTRGAHAPVAQIVDRREHPLAFPLLLHPELLEVFLAELDGNLQADTLLYLTCGGWWMVDGGWWVVDGWMVDGG